MCARGRGTVTLVSLKSKCHFTFPSLSKAAVVSVPGNTASNRQPTIQNSKRCYWLLSLFFEKEIGCLGPRNDILR